MTALALAAAGCSSGPAPGAPSSASPGSPGASASTATGVGLAGFYHQHLAWSGCGDGFSCTTLRVPLDYAHPAGRSIDVAVIRLPATDPAHRIGSLLINPGGPGASGVAYARFARYLFPAEIRARFDVVGFDPRGVGQSTAVHCLSTAGLDAYVAADPVPDAPGELGTLESVSRAFAAGCERNSGWLLPHVSTLDEARDMDVLRAALGDRLLTYLGKSYGTYLGAKYAQLFPTHIRALVLDGALDPSLSTEALDRTQAVGFETDLHDYLATCASSGRCPLGGTAAAAVTDLNRVTAQVDNQPLPGNGRQLGAGEFFAGLAAGLYDPSSGWPALSQAFAGIASGSPAAMLALTDQLTGRQPDGSYTNEMEANNAINCVDRPAPKSIATYRHDAAAFAALSPHFGAAIAWGSLVCAYWPVPPVETPHPVHAAGAPPILVVGTTRDPATPYVWAQALARQLASGVLLTFTGDGHTAYGRGSSCIDSAVDRYLLNATPPPPGVVCH